MKFGMVCLAALGVFSRYYHWRAPLPLSPVSKGNLMGALRVSFENENLVGKTFSSPAARC